MKLICALLMFVSIIHTGWANSLFNEDAFKSYTADKRASEVGDTVTIMIMETAEAASSAGNGSSGRFGMSLDAKAGRKDSDDNLNWSRDFNVGVGSDQEGDASNQRNGFIRAQLTAVVLEVDLNQNIVIRGKQSIKIDGEEQTIEITGKARVSDISSDNTLISTRLFDAQIKFTGQGEVSEGKDSGIFYKFFKGVGLI
ncbi:flagellar basal body L-ring protein FlgH [Catenovulum sp. SM1970]|uniref:flagellar basal body L-ring protein FlgH n=1 Tax=Marinifaba aquimaris TaxID=2741323 RepID=UPI0015745D45|nr:flagellar basal body L-ring protein FlgH [Marinifaba aquimaris]NTS77391.1 flagellar basal body L-ring protein FlgH [Marinifaba aquimaris]